MKKSKEYKISVALFIVSIVVFCLSAITGLFITSDTSIDKIFLFLGFAFLCLGYVFLNKSQKNKDNKEE